MCELAQARRGLRPADPKAIVQRELRGRSALLELKQRGVTVVIVSHRPSTINVVDKILVLSDGAVEMFGSRAEVLARLTRPATGPAIQPVPAVR